MFYTYLRGLVAFILWVLNGNAHYHHKDNIPDREMPHTCESTSQKYDW